MWPALLLRPMKFLRYLSLLLGPAAPALAQLSVSALHQEPQRSPADSLNAPLCAEYRAQARREIARGRLRLEEATLPTTFPTSRTFWELLAREYEITATFVNGGDVVPPETGCYNEVMIPAIEAKHGRGILPRLARQADSLDRAGWGFRDAHPAGFTAAEDLFNQQFAYKADFRHSHRLLVSIRFDVDGRGPISHLRLHWCPRGSGPLLPFTPLPATHRYYAEARRILRARRWQAATLRARPIKTTVYFHLGYVGFYPDALD